MATVCVSSKSKNTRKHVFECKVCSKVCLGAKEFRTHFFVHGSSRPYKCDECCQTFKSKDSLQRHIYKHEGKKPFLCDTCGKGFCTNQILKEHTAIHNNEKLYSCSMCDRAFRHNSGLSRHLLVHQNQPNHMCHICGQLFLNSAYLSSHMRSHSGERCFTCKICFHQFKHASSLSRHCAQRHKEPKSNKNEVCSLCPDTHFSSVDSLIKHKRKFHFETNNNQESEMELVNKRELNPICRIQEPTLESEILGQYRISAQLEVINSQSVHGLSCEDLSLERLLQFAQKCQTVPTPVDIHVFKSMTHIMKQIADRLAASSSSITNSQFKKYLTALNILQSVISNNLLVIKDKHTK